MTVREALMEATGRLRAAGVEAPWLDAELLLARALDTDRTGLYREPERVLTRTEQDRLEQTLLRRQAREPMAYISGRREFWGLDMAVTPAVLVPRPETELLVEEALKAVGSRTREVLILDLCTGSGCVAVALACGLPRARVVATDLSAEALAVARTNARTHGVAERVAFRQGDLWEPVEDLAGRIDVVTANPPYIPTSRIGALAPEVSRYEPSVALDGGQDGLAVIRRIVEEAWRFLRPGGILLMEVGEEGIPPLPALERYRSMAVSPDLSGTPRVVRLERA